MFRSLRRTRHAALLTFGLVALAAHTPHPGVAQESSWPSGAGPGGFVLEGVRIFDGEQAMEAGWIWVADGLIRGVGASGTALPAGADGAVRVQGAGHTVLPGLIDAHTHTFDRSVLVDALRFGVTTELDQFTLTEFAGAMRAEQAAGPVTDRADLFSAGTLATAPGGHGTQYGLAIPTLTGPDEAPGFVADRKGEGSDWLKIIWEDGSNYGMVTPTHAPETIEALIEAAHREELLAVAHVSTLAQARAVARMGGDGLVHAPHDRAPDAELAGDLAAADLFLVPTLTVTRSIATGEEGDLQLGDARLAELANPMLEMTLYQSFPARDAVARAHDHAAHITRDFARAGGRVLAGTDAPNPGTAHGLSMHREMELLVEAGLTATQALTAATSAPARAFGLEDRGRISPGLRADLVVVEGDPTVDITDTRNLVVVWRNGAPLDVTGVRARMVAAREAKARGGDGAAAGGAGLPVPGPVSDFDGDVLTTSFGAGWEVSTDQVERGSSTGRIEAVDGAMKVTGEVVGEGFVIWSGATFSPGQEPMAPADLSAARGVRFRARGEAPALTILLFSGGSEQMPAWVVRQIGEEWSQIEVPFSEVRAVDPAALTGVFIGVSGQRGSYTLFIDDVEFY
jgi:imidazolonepropionase-like amidohydrolase